MAWCVGPTGVEEQGETTSGFSRNLRGPTVSTEIPGRSYRVNNSRPVAGTLGGSGSETRVYPWYRQAKETKHGRTGGRASQHLIVPVKQGTSPTGPCGGKEVPRHGPVGRKHGECIETHNRVNATTTDSVTGCHSAANPCLDEPYALIAHVLVALEVARFTELTKRLRWSQV